MEYVEANPLVALHEEYAACPALFDPDTGTSFTLNPVGVLIWNHLDGHHTLSDLVKLTRTAFHEVPEEAEAHIRDLLSELVEKGLAGYVYRPGDMPHAALPPIISNGTRSRSPVSPPRSAPADHEKPVDDIREFFYRKTSMVPTFVPGELLSVKSVDADTVRAGDIIVFHSPFSSERIAHRVVHVTPLGFVTRGDNAACDTDPWILRPEQIVGAVTHAGRDELKRPVHGGFRGLLIHYAQRFRLRAVRAFRRSILPPRSRNRVGRFLEPLNLSQLLPCKHRPRLFAVARSHGYELMLILGNRVIARKSPLSEFWSVRFFYLPFVDVGFVRSAGRRLLGEEEENLTQSR
jgi:SynChlorMet cassette protein ScmD